MHNLHLLCQMWANSPGGVLPYATSEKGKITFLFGLLTSSIKSEIIGTFTFQLCSDSKITVHKKVMCRQGCRFATVNLCFSDRITRCRRRARISGNLLIFSFADVTSIFTQQSAAAEKYLQLVALKLHEINQNS